MQHEYEKRDKSREFEIKRSHIGICFVRSYVEKNSELMLPGHMTLFVLASKIQWVNMTSYKVYSE